MCVCVCVCVLVCFWVLRFSKGARGEHFEANCPRRGPQGEAFEARAREASRTKPRTKALGKRLPPLPSQMAPTAERCFLIAEFPPTAKPGVLDDISKPDKWIDKIKIRWHAPFFVHGSEMIEIVMDFLCTAQK